MCPKATDVVRMQNALQFGRSMSRSSQQQQYVWIIDLVVPLSAEWIAQGPTSGSHLGYNVLNAQNLA